MTSKALQKLRGMTSSVIHKITDSAVSWMETRSALQIFSCLIRVDF